MARADDLQDGNGPGWRQRAVSKSLSAARSRAEQRVQGLLDAGFALIDERGTTEFTIQEVVDRSKQSLRGFYQYFEGKDELLFALLEESIRESLKDLRRPWSPSPSRSSGFALSRSVCMSGASRWDAPQARRPQPRGDLGVLVAARAQGSRAPGRGDDADLADADRGAQGRRRGRRLQVTDTPRAALLIQQTVMYGWLMNRFVQNPSHVSRPRTPGILPPRPRRLTPGVDAANELLCQGSVS